MNWTEHCKPNDEIRYDHIKLDTPIGQFVIDWKSWKELPSYDISFNDIWIDVQYNLNDAKLVAEKYLLDKYNDLKIFLNL